MLDERRLSREARRAPLARATLFGALAGTGSVTFTSISYAAALVRICASDGAPIREILQGTGLSPGDLTDVDGRLEAKRFLRLATNAMAVTGDPTLGLRLGRALDVPAHGFAGYAALTKPTLADAQRLLLDTMHTRTSVFDVTVGTRGGEAFVDFAPLEDLGEALVFCVEATLSSVTAMAATVLGIENPVPGGRLEVGYDEPLHFDAYERFDMVRVTFGCPHHRIYFPVGLLDRALALSASYSTGHPDRALSAESLLDRPVDVTQRLRVLLQRNLAKPPTVAAAAERLGVSSRTLRRRLEERGTTFGELLDGLRFEHAEVLVASEGVPMGEIARRLGYSDAANFRRAFRKWAGVTPAEYRRARSHRDVKKP